MMRPIITLTTDFGTQDSYVGAMKGVILSRCPDANIIDISHEIAPQAVASGAYALAGAARYFPPRAIHLAVVDPGVGSDRRPIALSTPAGAFVAPDNGILTRIVAALDPDAVPDATPRVTADAPSSVRIPDDCRAVVLDDPSFWLPEVSLTFHGRDIFAPVAAALACGAELSEVGSPIDTIAVLPMPKPQASGATQGAIVYIDRYGNLITDIPAAALVAGARVRIAQREIAGLSASYAERPGELLAIIGSAGTLEIAVGNGSAEEALGAKVGDVVVVKGKRRDGHMTTTLFSERALPKFQLDDGTGLRIVDAEFRSESKFSWDMFRGYDSLKILTYSASIKAVFELLSEDFDFQRFECVFGCERVIRDFSDILAFQKVAVSDTRAAIMGLKDERHAKILSMVREGRADFYVVRKHMSHAKIYLLEDSVAGRRRVIYGSANLSSAAFSGEQTETLVKHDDDDAAWEFFTRIYEDVKATATNRVELPPEQVKTANIQISEIPAVKEESSANVVIHDPNANDVKTIYQEAQIERIVAAKEELKPTVAKILPAPRNGMQTITPQRMQRVRAIKIVNSPEEADHRYLSFDSGSGIFDLCGEPFSLEWDDEKVRNDVRLMVRYFTQYEGNFNGDVPTHQRNYFILWSWLYFSPFMCDLRIRASLSRGGDEFRYPHFAIVFGKSACGKSKLIETLTDSMFKRDLMIPKVDFTKGKLRGLRENYKRLPVYFDDIAKGPLRNHGFDVIKDTISPGELSEYPPFVISMNADFGSFPTEITRRTLMIYTDTALPAYDERLRARLDPILAEIQEGTTTHLFRRYASEVAKCLRDDPNPSDWLELSSGILSEIIREYVEGPMPLWAAQESWDEYAGRMRFERIRNSLAERLRPEAMLESGASSTDEDGWRFEGEERIIIISPKDNWGRRESYWEDVPSTLIDEDASYGSRIVLNRTEVEKFLGKQIVMPIKSTAESEPPENVAAGARRGFLPKLATMLGFGSR